MVYDGAMEGLVFVGADFICKKEHRSFKSDGLGCGSICFCAHQRRSYRRFTVPRIFLATDGHGYARSVSEQAKRDLIDAFLQQNKITNVAIGPVEWRRMFYVDEEEQVMVSWVQHDPRSPGNRLQKLWRGLLKPWRRLLRRGQLEQQEEHPRAGERQLQQERIENEMAMEIVMSEIVQEIQQLASRLLVEHQDLYGKYDRQMTEASVRINVAVPLTVMLLLATWLAGLSCWLRIVLTLVILAFGFMLLRQGFLRAISGARRHHSSTSHW